MFFSRSKKKLFDPKFEKYFDPNCDVKNIVIFLDILKSSSFAYNQIMQVLVWNYLRY